MRLVWGFVLCVLMTTMARIQDEPLTNTEVLRVVPRTDKQVQRLRRMLEQMEEDIDTWQQPSYPDRNVDFMLNKRNENKIKRKLTQMGLIAEVMIQDVEQVVLEQEFARILKHAKPVLAGDTEREITDNRVKKDAVAECGNKENQVTGATTTTTTAAPTTTAEPSVWHTDYHDLSEIQTWMDGKASSYPNIVSLENIGSSYYGEPMKVLKIKTKDEDSTRQKVWIQCGIHAREWISPATCMYIIDQILINYNTNSSITATVDKYDWYFLPVTNPDGYKYTWTDSRLWRKTRSPNSGTSCRGTDPNRNYPADWGNTGGSRSSSNPCSNTYHGSSPKSEPEINSVITYLDGLTNWKINIDVHSYGQMWLTPYGYTSQTPSDHATIMAAAQTAVNALQAVHGTQYEYGTIYSVIYAVSGGSNDWAYDDLSVTYSYGLELRDKGNNGFLLPANQILPTAEETMAGILALADYVTP